jgi:MFS family permease
MPQLVRALRHRNYQLFFGGQLISLVGTWMQTIAESWLVYRLTGSSVLLGVAAFCSQIPIFLLSPIGGVVADRFNRHRIIIVTQTISMLLPLTLAALTLSHHVRVWHVFVLATCLGIVNAFDIPARQSFFVHMVGHEDLPNAIALNSAMFNGARVLGPSIAGILVAAVGEGWCFLLNGISYIAVITGLLMMTVVPPVITQRGSAVADIVDGFRFVVQTVPVRTVLILVGIVSFAGIPYTVLMPVFADAILHQGPKGLGLLMASTGVGALGGALTLAARSGVRGLGRLVAISAAAFGVTLGLFGFSHTFWLSTALLIPVGAAMMVQMASCNTLLQAMVPDTLRGRVMSIYSMMLMGMSPIGALLAGAVAEHIGAPWTVAIGGAVTVASAAVFATRIPHFRAEARQLIATQGLGLHT